jgi:hypothetical protein
MTDSECLVSTIVRFEAKMMVKMDTRWAKIEVNREELMSAMKSSQESVEALVNVNLKTMEASLEKTEANQK